MTIWLDADLENGSLAQFTSGTQVAGSPADGRTGQVAWLANDAGGTITPAAGPTTLGMMRTRVFDYLQSGMSIGQDAGEALWNTAPTPGNVKNQTHFISVALYFPSSSNWDTNFFNLGFPRWCFVGQLGYESIGAGPSVSIDVIPANWEGTAGLHLGVRIVGGLVSATQTVEYTVVIDPAAGNGWDTLKALPGSYGNPQRVPQILGPNCFGTGGAGYLGNRPFTLNAWHQFIFEIKWTTDVADGFVKVWHRYNDDALAGNTTWVKTFEKTAIKTFQYLAGGAGGDNSLYKFGGYCRASQDLTVYHDQMSICSTFAEAEGFFAVGAATSELEQIGFRGYRGTESVGIAAENTNFTWPVEEAFAMRFVVQEAGGAQVATTAQLQANVNGGAWFNVTAASTFVQSAAVSYETDDAATTDQMTAGAGTFVAGWFDGVDGLTPSVTISANGYTEFFFGVRMLSTVADGDLVQLRVVLSGDAAPAYTFVPTVTADVVLDRYGVAVAATTGLTAYWRANDADAVLRDHFAVVNGSYVGGYLQGQTGITGSGSDDSVDFNGSSGYATVPVATPLNLGNANFTLEGWVKRDSTGSLDVIFDKGAGSYTLYIHTDDTIRFGISGGADIVVSTSTLTNTTIFHHVVVAYTGGATVSLWLDGVDVTGTPSAQTLADNASALTLGARTS